MTFDPKLGTGAPQPALGAAILAAVTIDDESRSPERLTEEIAALWTEAAGASVDARTPMFLAQPLLLERVGVTTGTVVQVLDMERYKSVYVTPNILEASGYTPEENSAAGVWQWLRNLSAKELVFQVRNARIVRRAHDACPPRTPWRQVLINSGIRMKNGQRRRILCQNIALEWNERGQQRYQLALWRDATHMFTSTDVVAMNEWTLPDRRIVWTYSPERGFVDRDLLSQREREVLAMVARGLSSKEIGDQLAISSATVDNHRKAILKRLQVKTTEYAIEINHWLRLF